MKYEKQESGFLIVLLGTSMMGNTLTEKCIMRDGKSVGRVRTEYNKIDHTDHSSIFLSNIKITTYFNYKPKFNGFRRYRNTAM